MPTTIDLTGDDDDAAVDDLSSLLASTSLGPPAKGVHPSLEAMLALARRRKLRVAGDGNCAYHASCACLPEAHLRSRCSLRAVEHAGKGSSATHSDLQLQREVRQRVVDFLQLPASAHHRFVGTNEDIRWDDDAQAYVSPPPPPASAMERHRRDGTYAQTPQLRGLAEVLQCCLVSIDTSALFDRVPCFTHGQSKTVKLRSWRDEIAPVLARGRSLVEGMPTAVILNNGRLDASGHFDGTAAVRAAGD